MPNGRQAAGEDGSRVATPRMHLLTIAVEDYFHVAPLQTVIAPDRYYRFEMRLVASTQRALDLLDECGARATFFVLGWVADAAPELVREIVARGHEVASKGYHHRHLREITRQAFHDDALRAKETLEQTIGRAVRGYRLAQDWLRPGDDWVLETLVACGYEYDSSVRLVLRTYAKERWRQFPHRLEIGTKSLLEVPLSSLQLLGLDVPIAGGNYFRQFPDTLVRRAVAHWDRHYAAPFVMYFHTWELDPEQPRIHGVPLRQQIRQYRNLRKMPGLVQGYLRQYRFTSIGEFFALDSQPAAGLDLSRQALEPTPLRYDGEKIQAWVNHPAPMDVTVVVPCYNEEQSLPYLANTLRSVVSRYRGVYRFNFVFVDDCSTDRTWAMLQETFGARPDCALLRHAQNRGVAGAIQTGIRGATTEVICSMDCDCTYDPHDLGRMIPLLTDDVDIVTASPYHPAGSVKNVPRWRLFLSKTLSRLYRLILRQKLYTYTSCFRVYRRPAVIGLEVERGGFFGVTEMLGRLDLGGRRIVEFPTLLEARVLGRSKMKILRTIAGHLSLLGQLAWLRWVGGRTAQAGRLERV